MCLQGLTPNGNTALSLRHFVFISQVTRESGPPHMRIFVTRCTVGDFVTDGDGNGKKISKKRAAERMLDKLKVRLKSSDTMSRGQSF